MPITTEILDRKPPAPKHASRAFAARAARPRTIVHALKPEPLSVPSHPPSKRMASSLNQDSVTADGHLRQDPTPEDAPTELAAVVDELLDGLSAKFSSVSAEIFARMDDMSRRLDNLEATIQAGGDSVQSK